MRALLRRYPDFADVRAALAAALWADGARAAAETEWDRVDDPRCVACWCEHKHACPAVLTRCARYKDRNWLRRDRRWPPALAGACCALCTLAHDN